MAYTFREAIKDCHKLARAAGDDFVMLSANHVQLSFEIQEYKRIFHCKISSSVEAPTWREAVDLFRNALADAEMKKYLPIK